MKEIAFTRRELKAAAGAVVRLFRRWKLSDEVARQILGNVASETYARWQRSEFGPIDHDLGMRLSLLIGVHKCLRTLFKEPTRGYEWIRRENSALDGQPPLEIMARGDIASLARVRTHLEDMIADLSAA